LFRPTSSKRLVVTAAAGALVARSVMNDCQWHTSHTCGQFDCTRPGVRPSVTGTHWPVGHGDRRHTWRAQPLDRAWPVLAPCVVMTTVAMATAARPPTLLYNGIAPHIGNTQSNSKGVCSAEKN